MAVARGFSRARRVETVAAVGLLLGLPSVARAESVRAAVANHLAAELPEKTETSSTDGTSPYDESPASAETAAPASEDAGSAAPAPAPAVARRLQVLGRPAYLDVSLQSRMQVWLPAQHPSVHLAAAPYRTYSLEISGGVQGLLTLHRLALETDGSTWIGWSGPIVAPAAAGTTPLGAAAAVATIGLPLLRWGSATWWEPIVRYEVSTFATTATPSRPVCLVARGADTSADPPACTRTDGPLRMASSFESLVVGVQLGGADGSAFLHTGIDVVRQRKPYQVNVAGRTLDDYLFDARFGGAGLALGFGAGGDRGFSFRGGVHLGLAWVSLTDDLSLGDELPADWQLEYLRWNAAVGYGHVLVKGPPLLLVRASVDASGSHFIYERDASEETPSLSRDLFFAGSLALTLML